MNDPCNEPSQKSKGMIMKINKSKRFWTKTGAATEADQIVSEHKDNPIGEVELEYKERPPIGPKGFLDKIEKFYKSITDVRDETNEEYKRICKELKEYESSKENGESRKQKGFILVEKICQFLAELESESKSFVLKRKCEEALGLFDINEEIIAEIDGSDSHIVSLREKLAELENKLERCIKQVRRLEDIKHTIKEHELDDGTLPESVLSNEDNIFSLAQHNINTTVNKYRACDFAEILFDIEEVERQELIDLGKGVRVSKPVAVERELRKVGICFHASISHHGIIAIYSFNGTSEEHKAHKYTRGDRKRIIQFTDLSSTRQVEMEVEYFSLVGFYDNLMIVLTLLQPLREASAESVFDNPTLDVLKRVGSVDRVGSWTDVSLLHNTRVLYYIGSCNILYEYNVDTHINTKIDIGKKASLFASMTGIDVGVKGIFQEYEGDLSTFILNKDNTTTQIGENQFGFLNNFLPSFTFPSDIKRGMFKCLDYFIFNKRKIQPKTPLWFEDWQSLVRIYKDIFLAYDMNTHQWVLIRIPVP